MSPGAGMVGPGTARKWAGSLTAVSSHGPNASETEVEWQFDALDLRPVERWLAAPRLHPPGGALAEVTGAGAHVAVEPQATRRLVDAYLDTADWRIGQSGFVLRIRRKAGGAEVTLKDGGKKEDGLRRRLEATEELPDGGLGALGRDGPVGRRLDALVGTRPLGKVLEVRTRRRPYAVRLEGEEVAEVALDDTLIEVAAGTPPVRMRRVEVEVNPNAIERVRPLVDKLRSDCGLQPAALSKFEAGLLASGMEIPGEPDLGVTELSPMPSVGELAFVVLRRNLGAMLAHEAGTRLGEDPEQLHDMRVATRRMRAALAMFADVLPVRAQHFRDELGWVADVLGAVRDLDVQLERVDEWTSAVATEDRAALDDLARLLSQQRHDAQRRLLACLESTRYDRLVSGFAGMLRQGPSRRSVPARAPAVVVVPDLLRDRHQAVTKAAKKASRSGAPEDFHKLRIRCKRLRYALEFVSEIYGTHTSKYVRSLVRTQDTLGLMQDARVAADRLHGLVVERGDVLSRLTIFVMGGVAERYRQEAARLARKVPRRVKAVSGRRWDQLAGFLERRRLEATPRFGWTTTGALMAPVPPPAPVSAVTLAPSPTAAMPAGPAAATEAVPPAARPEPHRSNGHQAEPPTGGDEGASP